MQFPINFLMIEIKMSTKQVYNDIVFFVSR